jgi:predicted dithiol-disulfide oxidoreductase (DUF899 family)
MQKSHRFEDHPIVSKARWLEARRALLLREKELTRQRDALSAARRALPWARDFNGITAHVAQRDVTLMAVSRAPARKLAAFAQRMGWTFPWASSHASTFNVDFGVSFTREALASGQATYNYEHHGTDSAEMPGISVFAKNARGDVFHTYSCFSRGIDALNVAYQYLDLVPKGRDEDGLSFSMAWLRLRDQYE